MASTYLPILNWPIYSGWCAYTPVIPKLYWDKYSQEQIVKELCRNYDKLEHYMDYIAGLTNTWVAEYANKTEEKLDNFEKLVEDGYKEALNIWIKRDMPNVIKDAIKQVYFGLNLEGYFVGYIPESWDDIIFDTGMNYGEDTYGRLILRYDVDNSGESVNQRPENWR